MLLDHVRETFFLHRQVGDPMDVATTEPALFLSRTLAHLCAPVFVFLTGLSAWLYAEKHPEPGAASRFLLKRGLVLILLELTLVNFAWTFSLPPQVIYLQVIWAIGLCMLALAALLWLPRPLLVMLGVVLIGGHNLLDGVHFAPGHFAYVPWAVLHDRGWIEVAGDLRLRTSYPLLPWVGVIALGYAAGPWFGSGASAAQRRPRLLVAGLGALALFAGLRAINGYGEKPWQAGADFTHTVMSLFNVTKYPPSLAFVALTLGMGLCLLVALERWQGSRGCRWLATFGAAPMFFYLLHLYVLKLLYLGCYALWGSNQGSWFGFSQVWMLWLATLVLAVVLYRPVQAFAELKARRRDITWLKYF
ncbi:heparan-alpha-glucosaminide N-acetyltransferase domain-containing protein [Pseudomonas sp. KNUC1026]|nr:heparan-alpha-glucosaminide N-acetyltransferase domain-containing protein [Pseudomonas sp. KNUC1026]